MAIEIEEKFEIEAPIERVWDFISTPELVVGCLPGAKLVEVIDERNFLGRVKIKLGAVTAAYKGKMHFQEGWAGRMRGGGGPTIDRSSWCQTVSFHFHFATSDTNDPLVPQAAITRSLVEEAQSMGRAQKSGRERERENERMKMRE